MEGTMYLISREMGGSVKIVAPVPLVFQPPSRGRHNTDRCHYTAVYGNWKGVLWLAYGGSG